MNRKGNVRGHLTICVTSIFLVALFLTGCAELVTYTPTAPDLTALAEQYHGDDKELVQATAVARYLTADAAQAAQAQAQAQIAALEATRQAAARAEQNQWLAMTAEAQSTANALSAQATAQALSAQATQQALAIQSTAQAEIVQATREAERIRTTQTTEARSWSATTTAEALNRGATATAAYKADRATETRQAWDARQTATTESIRATESARHATATIAAEKREIVLGYGRDYGIPFVLLLSVAGLIFAIVVGFQELKKRPVVMEPSVFGDSQQIRLPTPDGGFNLIDVDTSLPGGVLRVHPDGTVEAPVLRDLDREERDKYRDQLVNMATRPRVGPGRARLPMPDVEFAPPPRNRGPVPGLTNVFECLEGMGQAAQRGILPPRLAEAIEAQWQEVEE